MSKKIWKYPKKEQPHGFEEDREMLFTVRDGNKIRNGIGKVMRYKDDIGSRQALACSSGTYFSTVCIDKYAFVDEIIEVTGG